MWGLSNILFDDIQQSFIEIYENEQFFSVLTELLISFIKRKKNIHILARFLASFTHNYFFINMEHETNFVIYLKSFFINDLKDRKAVRIYMFKHELFSRKSRIFNE